jgi:hypothetical protein
VESSTDPRILQLPFDEPSSPLALLGTTREEVDRVLRQIPDNRLEARRLVTREWGLDPTPEELQTIIRLAHDPAGQHGLECELARTALAARIFLDRELHRLQGSDGIELARIRETNRNLPQLVSVVDVLTSQLRSIGEIASAERRAFLRQVGETLVPRRDALVAAGVMAPHLERLAGATDTHEILAALPGLTDTEATRLGAAICPAPGATLSGDEPGRLGIEAMVLGAVIRQDLAHLRRILGPGSEVGREDTPDSVELVERLSREQIACRFLSECLKKKRDGARLAGLTGYAERLGVVQSDLQTDHRALRAVLEENGGSDKPIVDDTDLQRLLQESAVQDALTEAERAGQVSEDEAILEALKDVESSAERTRRVVGPAYDRARERVRIRLLSGIAAALLAVGAAVWLTHLEGPTDPLAVTATELSDTLILDRTASVGPMMHVVVSHWSWDDKTDEERLASVRALGLSAANEGYETVYLVGENGEELALWRMEDGARLMDRPALGNDANAGSP